MLISLKINKFLAFITCKPSVPKLPTQCWSTIYFFFIWQWADVVLKTWTMNRVVWLIKPHFIQYLAVLIAINTYTSQHFINVYCLIILKIFVVFVCYALLLYALILLIKVARKLVLMEQDLERSEEKVELSERFVPTATKNDAIPFLQKMAER